MAYISNFQQFSEWISDNGIKKWVISSSTNQQDNNKKFAYNDEKDFDDNMELCRRALERFSGTMLYATGWRGESARTGGFSCQILYGSTGVSTPAAVAGYDAASLSDMEARIEERIKTRYEKERYEHDRKELDEERKEFDRQKEGVIGLLVNYLAPAVPALSGLMKGTRIQGVDAEPIRVKHDVEPSDEEGDAAAFSDEEAEQLYALMERLKAVEPDYLKLLQRVVEMAEAGDQTYLMARGFILK